jgi:hypothetical protein
VDCSEITVGCPRQALFGREFRTDDQYSFIWSADDIVHTSNASIAGAAVGIRVTAWGNQRDCLYAPAVCLPFARGLFGAYDVRDTQWLGVDRAMRRDYGPGSSLASLAGRR